MIVLPFVYFFLKTDDAFLMMRTIFNNCTVSSKRDITQPEFEINSLTESSTETKYTERGQKKYNTGVTLIKITFLATLVALHLTPVSKRTSQ